MPDEYKSKGAYADRKPHIESATKLLNMFSVYENQLKSLLSKEKDKEKRKQIQQEISYFKEFTLTDHTTKNFNTSQSLLNEKNRKLVERHSRKHNSDEKKRLEGKLLKNREIIEHNIKALDEQIAKLDEQILNAADDSAKKQNEAEKNQQEANKKRLQVELLHLDKQLSILRGVGTKRPNIFVEEKYSETDALSTQTTSLLTNAVRSIRNFFTPSREKSRLTLAAINDPANPPQYTRQPQDSIHLNVDLQKILQDKIIPRLTGLENSSFPISLGSYSREAQIGADGSFSIQLNNITDEIETKRAIKKMVEYRAAVNAATGKNTTFDVKAFESMLKYHPTISKARYVHLIGEYTSYLTSVQNETKNRIQKLDNTHRQQIDAVSTSMNIVDLNKAVEKLEERLKSRTEKQQQILTQAKDLSNVLPEERNNVTQEQKKQLEELSQQLNILEQEISSDKNEPKAGLADLKKQLDDLRKDAPTGEHKDLLAKLYGRLSELEKGIDQRQTNIQNEKSVSYGKFFSNTRQPHPENPGLPPNANPHLNPH